ncbi:MAG: hypothetical protein QM630_03815 [Microbacterium sp.]
MSDAPQPELRWAPIPPKPNRAKRVWLIVGIVFAALVASIIVLYAVLPHGHRTDAEGTASPTPSNSVTTTPSPSASATPTASPEPTTLVTEPPVVDPDVDTFRGKVSGWLSDGGRGLEIIAATSGQDALSVIDTLQEDAQRLSDAQPPTSILEQWYTGVSAYSDSLEDLRTAVTAGSGVSGAIDAARTELTGLKELVGL